MCGTVCEWRSENNLSELAFLPSWVLEVRLKSSDVAAGAFYLLSHLDMPGFSQEC